MKGLEQQIIDCLSDVQNLITDFKSILEKTQQEKKRLSAFSKQMRDERSASEQQAMFLEDCIGHTPISVFQCTQHETNPQNYTKQKARDKLMAVFGQGKLANSSVQMQNVRKREEINEMISKINFQQQQLFQEEQIVSDLRKQEEYKKQLEIEKIDAVMKQFYEASDVFQELHDSNKEKKRNLLQIQQENKAMMQKIENAKKEMIESNNKLKQTRIFTQKLTKQRQKLQMRSLEIANQEEQLNKLRFENAHLSQNEVVLNEIIGNLTVEYDNKKKKVLSTFYKIEQIEDLLDQTVNKKV